MSTVGRPEAKPSGRAADGGWVPDQGSQPVNLPRQRRGRSRFGTSIVAGGLGVAAAAAIAGAVDRGQPTRSGFEPTGTGTTITGVDTGRSNSSPLALDLANGTVSVTTPQAEPKADTPVVEARVQQVNHQTKIDAPAQQTPPPTLENLSNPYVVAKNETVSAIVIQGEKDAGFDRPSHDQVFAGIAVEKVIAGLDNADKVGEDQTINVLNLQGIDEVASAVVGQNADGSEASPEVKAAAAELVAAVNAPPARKGEPAYNSVVAAEKSRNLLAVLDIAVPTPVDTTADQSGQPDQQNEPFNGVEPLAPMPDAERAGYIEDAQAVGSVVLTDFNSSTIWDQQRARDDNDNNPTTNITSRIAVVLTGDNPDPTVNQEGTFDEHKMHHGDKFAEINPVLNPVIEGIASLSYKQLSQIQPDMSPEAFQALLTIWNINHDQTDIPNRDKAAADVALIFSYMLDLHDIPNAHPGLQALLRQLEDKSPREAAVIITENIKVVSQELFDPAFPHVDADTTGPKPTKVRITVGGITTEIDVPVTTDPAVLRAFVDAQGDLLVDQGKIADPDAADALVKQEVQKVVVDVPIPLIHPDRDLEFRGPDGAIIVVTIPESVITIPNPAEKAVALRAFVADKARELDDQITDPAFTTEANAAELTRLVEAKVVGIDIDVVGTPPPATPTHSATPTEVLPIPPAPTTPDNTSSTAPVWIAGGLGALLLAGGAALGIPRARRWNRERKTRNKAENANGYQSLPEINVPEEMLTKEKFDAAATRLEENAFTETQERDPDNEVPGENYPKNTFYTRDPEELRRMLIAVGFADEEAYDTFREQVQKRHDMTAPKKAVRAFRIRHILTEDPHKPGNMEGSYVADVVPVRLPAPRPATP